MSNTTLAHAPTPTDDQIDRILDAMADAFVHQLRSPIMHTLSEQNRRTRTPRFPRSTACGWFIPADGSEKLIIANHPMGSVAPGFRRIWNRGDRSGVPVATRSR